MPNKRNSHFKHGSGCFTCYACKRRTRATGGDNDSVLLCEECYEIAGLENSIADHGDPQGLHAASIAGLKARCIAKGGQL